MARFREEGRDFQSRGEVTCEQSPGGDTEKAVSGVVKEASLDAAGPSHWWKGTQVSRERSTQGPGLVPGNRRKAEASLIYSLGDETDANQMAMPAHVQFWLGLVTRATVIWCDEVLARAKSDFPDGERHDLKDE